MNILLCLQNEIDNLYIKLNDTHDAYYVIDDYKDNADEEHYIFNNSQSGRNLDLLKNDADRAYNLATLIECKIVALEQQLVDMQVH